MSRMSMFNSPLLLGFDQLERTLDRLAKNAEGYPPYNIERIGENGLRITLAVAGFTLDREVGTFVLTQEKITIPEDTSEFAINMSNMRNWDAPVRRYIDECLAGKTGVRERDFNMRWVASMVADVFRVLSRGGIFMYPRDAKHTSGRLRLMYEANPMSFIVEQAGGAATDGRQRILDIAPEKLHQRVGVILGSKNEVERVTGYHAK